MASGKARLFATIARITITVCLVMLVVCLAGLTHFVLSRLPDSAPGEQTRALWLLTSVWILVGGFLPLAVTQLRCFGRWRSIAVTLDDGALSIRHPGQNAFRVHADSIHFGHNCIWTGTELIPLRHQMIGCWFDKPFTDSQLMPWLAQHGRFHSGFVLFFLLSKEKEPLHLSLWFGLVMGLLALIVLESV